MADHNQITSSAVVGPYSGVGEIRPLTARARRTNSPLDLPATLRGKGQTPEGRRWRDLCRHYGSKIGNERLADEGIRAKLLSLIHLTLRLEQMRDAATPLPLHSELHAVQELRTLLQDLGLNGDTNNFGNAHELPGYLSADNGDAT
jgi:hypothetical protein